MAFSLIIIVSYW